MADVFISYSRAKKAAAELARKLDDLGFTVWWDTSLIPARIFFPKEIDRQLNAARAVVVIWSPASAKSYWVYSEARHGDRQDKLVNTRTSALLPEQIPKPFDVFHCVLVDDIRAIEEALDHLNVPRSGRQPVKQPEPPIKPDPSRAGQGVIVHTDGACSGNPGPGG
jgi:hypothetical protein